MFRFAWISDDAYITFRSVENFVAGYGMGYNPFVRVQSFTHPLWMLVISAAYFFQTRVFDISLPGGLYFLTIMLSLVVSGVCVWLALIKLARNDAFSVAIMGAGLVLSKAFVDYSTSGLEAPLTHFLLVLFLWLYLDTSPKLVLLALISSLIAMTRLDLVLIVAPALVGSFWAERTRWRNNIGWVLLGFLPLIVWELFSLFYFGFPFPNTAYAKLNTGITNQMLIRQGLNYLLNSLRWDPITLLTIFCAGLGLFFDRTRNKVLLYVGALFYVLYVIKIGGDFMSGRFLTGPFLIALSVVSQLNFSGLNYFRVGYTSLVVAALFLVRPQVFAGETSFLKDKQAYIDKNGIADERMVYFELYGLPRQTIQQSDSIGSPFAGKKWVYTGYERVLVRGATGMSGYSKGPNIYVIDKYALTDPLLSRLPVIPDRTWRVGHYERAIPDGYRETLLSGFNQISDPNLADYYNELSFVVSGPLFSLDRMVAVWKLNTGQYDALIASYLHESNK